jgi:hypothetical protein
MTYKWHNIGDQDRCIRKVCFLGIWQLEVKEAGWKNDKLLVRCQAYMWSEENEDYLPVKMPGNKLKYYKKQGATCMKDMQDWYAEHVILPKIMMGTAEDG